MSPHERWLPVLLAVLLVICQCHRGRKPGANPQAPETLTVLLYGLPDSGALCRAADAVEETLAGEPFVKSLHVTGHEENEIVIEADPEKLHMVGVGFAALAEAVRRGLTAVPEEDMKADEEKNAVVIAMRECRPLDVDADKIMAITVKDPQGNFIPLGALAVLKIQARSRGLHHEGGRALKVEVALADGADHEEAKKSLERALAGRFDASMLQWDIR